MAAYRSPSGSGDSSDLVAAYGAVELVDIEEFPTIYAEKHTIIVISLSILSRMKFVLWARTNLLIISQPKGRPSGSNKPPYLVAAPRARPSGSNEPPDPVTAQGAPSGLNREPRYPVASQRGALRARTNILTLSHYTIWYASLFFFDTVVFVDPFETETLH